MNSYGWAFYNSGEHEIEIELQQDAYDGTCEHCGETLTDECCDERVAELERIDAIQRAEAESAARAQNAAPEPRSGFATETEYMRAELGLDDPEYVAHRSALTTLAPCPHCGSVPCQCGTTDDSDDETSVEYRSPMFRAQLPNGSWRWFADEGDYAEAVAHSRIV